MKTLYIQSSSSEQCKEDCLILDAWLLIKKDDSETLLNLDEWRVLDEFSRDWSERSLEKLKELDPQQAKYLSHLILSSAKLFLYQEMMSYQILKMLITRALQVHPYSELCFFGFERDWLANISNDFALPVRFKSINVTKRSLKERVLNFVKAKHLDWTVRAFSCLSLQRKSKLQEVDLVFSFDVHNKAMIATLNAVLKQAATKGFRCLALYYEKRVADQIFIHENVIKQPLLAFYAFSNNLKAVKTYQSQRRSLSDSDIEQLYTSEKSSIENLGLSRLRGIYTLQAMVDISAMRSMLDKVKPETIYLASDSHRSSRLLTVIAKEKKIKTVVAQHGAVVGAFAYVPVLADTMGVWGPWCQTWFERYGVPAHKLAVTGSPRAKKTHTLSSAMRKYFLLATQPVATSVTKDLLERAFKVLKHKPSYRLKIRPHPGEPQIAFLRSVIEQADASVQTQVELNYPASSLAEDLLAARAVITSQSTFGIDALQFSCPLIILSHPVIDEAIPFEEFKCALYAANSEELELHLEAVQQDDVQERLKASATKFLNAYTSAYAEEAAQALLDLSGQR